MKIRSSSLCFICVILATFILSGCGSYDEGYEEGSIEWGPGRKAPFFKSFIYKKGFNDGKRDAQIWDQGFKDAHYNSLDPQQTDNEIYMEGYKSGWMPRE